MVDAILDGENSLKAFRKWRGLTQKQLAQMSDTRQAYISELERDFDKATIETVKRLAEALDLDPAPLIV